MTQSPGDEDEAGAPQTGEAIRPQCGGDGKAEEGACPTCGGTGKIVAIVGDA